MTVNEIHHGVIEDGKESIQKDMKNPLDKVRPIDASCILKF